MKDRHHCSWLPLLLGTSKLLGTIECSDVNKGKESMSQGSESERNESANIHPFLYGFKEA